MDKKSKEALRRYKKARMAARQQSSSESSSSSSDSDSSYSSSGSDRHRKKKPRQGGQSRRSSSSSGDERRKREKREHCQKKLEAKRNHIKRKLKEAKLKKRAAAAAAVLSGHSHRALSPTTQAKLKKLAERKHLRAQSKERREREREKHRAAAREREREHRRTHSRSPTKITKIRIHQDVKRQKSPPRMHQMVREKIIIQARTRSHTPSVERERLRHEQKLRHEDLARERERRERERDRAEREAARDKERAEALARCQERQRERERIARDKLRREEEEKKYAGDRGERLGPRPGESVYKSRERSMDSDRNRHLVKRDIDVDYERERAWPYDVEGDRRGLIDRDDLRRRRDLSPGGEHYAGRRGDIYDEERERAYGRQYLDEPRHGREREAGWMPPHDLHERELREARDFRGVDHEMRYADERERELMRERTLAGRGDWKTNWNDSSLRGGAERNWDEAAPRSGFVGGPKRGGASNIVHTKIAAGRERTNSEPDWDANEVVEGKGDKLNVRDVAGFSGAAGGQREAWIEHDQRDLPREKILPGGRQPPEQFERRWQSDWRDGEDGRLGTEGGHHMGGHMHHHRADRGRGDFRRGMHHGYRGHAPGLMGMQGPGMYGMPRFPKARNMTYTNPNLIKKQQLAAKAAAQASAVAAATTAVAAAKAAAQSAANATTNPGILGQVTGARMTASSTAADNEKPEAGEILPENEETKETTPPETKTDGGENEVVTAAEAATVEATKTLEEKKSSGELSEISDSDDDILNKADRKSKSEPDELASEEANKIEEAVAAEKVEETLGVVLDRANDDEEMLDFEEISDGELEEEARHKGVGDALGVDWASLIAETKRQAENAAQPGADATTTAKQKWQPHRIILDIGISMRMAGEDYAKRLLSDAQQKLQSEQFSLSMKTEIKEEISSTADEDSQATMVATETTDAENTNNSDKKFDINKVTIKSGEEVSMETSTLSVEGLHPLACIQVAQRKRVFEQRQLFAQACGPNSRALSARQDLRLRRQLCGLPADEPNFPTAVPAVSDKLKAMALAAFKRTMEVK